MSRTQRLTGMIDFDRISELSTEIGGLTNQQHAIEGRLIKTGDPALELNTDLLRKDIEVKHKERAQLSVDIMKVETNRKRFESSLKNSSVSHQAYDDANFDLSSLQ